VYLVYIFSKKHTQAAPSPPKKGVRFSFSVLKGESKIRKTDGKTFARGFLKQTDFT
jgi:hypothetical protein